MSRRRRVVVVADRWKAIGFEPTGITPGTHSWGVGPVDLDITMARTLGWSERAIERTCLKLGAISRAETRRSHRKGRVPGCRCVECSPP